LKLLLSKDHVKLIVYHCTNIHSGYYGLVVFTLGLSTVLIGSLKIWHMGSYMLINELIIVNVIIFAAPYLAEPMGH
jgi:hypothetical protein